jgi:ssDNA-binding Zn-finger/Zn-ribbon topoisomerase 1
MLRLKSCPRCTGDILIDRDHFGWFEQCIQCGYQHDIKVSDKAKGHIRKECKKTLVKTGVAAEVAK